MNRMIVGLVCLLLNVAGTQAAHWTVNPHAYRYDMTIYAVLQVNGVATADYGRYEVAAFCGEECRGVARVLTTADGAQCLYLRVYSNEAQGEILSFKVYKPSDGEEKTVPETATFESQAMAGTPGDPFALTLEEVLTGDVNLDGTVDSGDVMAVYSAMAGNADAGLMQRADVNGDGTVDSGDVMAVYSIMAGS